MSRTALQIVQDAALPLGIARPSALFSSTDRTEQEVRRVLNDAAEQIMRAHDWQALKTLESYAGDGSTAAFVLPDDYDRMPKDTQVWSTRWQRPLLAITPEDYLRLDIREYDLVTGTWVIIGDQMTFTPALASDETAKWYYVSSYYAQSSGGSNKEAFTADDDVFRLDDKMLELMLIAKYRALKGLDYFDHMRDAQVALQQRIAADGGAKIVTQTSRRNIRAKTAYPWNVSDA